MGGHQFLLGREGHPSLLPRKAPSRHLLAIRATHCLLTYIKLDPGPGAVSILAAAFA